MFFRVNPLIFFCCFSAGTTCIASAGALRISIRLVTFDEAEQDLQTFHSEKQQAARNSLGEFKFIVFNKHIYIYMYA